MTSLTIWRDNQHFYRIQSQILHSKKVFLILLHFTWCTREELVKSDAFVHFFLRPLGHEKRLKEEGVTCCAHIFKRGLFCQWFFKLSVSFCMQTLWNHPFHESGAKKPWKFKICYWTWRCKTTWFMDLEFFKHLLSSLETTWFMNFVTP